MRRSLRVRVALLAVTVLVAGALPAAAGDRGGGDRGRGDDSAVLRRAVTVPGILEHELALQLIGTVSGGNRLSGAPGYDRSADYVAWRAAAAGLEVSTQQFDYSLDVLADFERPVLSVRRGERFVPGIGGAQFGGDFGSMYKSTPYAVDITAPVWAIDLVLPPGAEPDTSTSGCEESDYAGVPDGAIIIVQRGTCTFAQKFALADASPAGAMVLINEGQPGRTVPLWFNMDGIEVPTVAATIETGTALANGVAQEELVVGCPDVDTGTRVLEAHGAQPLQVPLVRQGVIDEDHRGSGAVRAAARHHIASRAALPYEGWRLSEGEPAIPTRHVVA